MINQNDINLALKKCESVFNEKYSDVSINFNEISGMSTTEILEEYEDFDDFSYSTIDYSKHNSPLRKIISHMNFKKDNKGNIILNISYNPTPIIEQINNYNYLIDDYDYCNDENELFNELFNDYFYIDLSNPLNW